MKKIKDKKPIYVKKPTFSCGDVLENIYTGTKLTEIISNKKTVGWIWSLTDGRVVVSPNLGFYLWFDSNNDHWTFNTGALWLSSRFI